MTLGTTLDRPFISIVIPAYNESARIGKALGAANVRLLRLKLT